MNKKEIFFYTQLLLKQIKYIKKKEYSSKCYIYTMKLINKIIMCLNISEIEIEKKRISKKLEKGSFDKRIFASNVLINKDDPLVEKYRKDSMEYTEMKISDIHISDNFVIFNCNKLVRNFLPEICIKKNHILIYRIAHISEFFDLLNKKLLEEYLEILDAIDNKKNIIEEIADFLEVFYAIHQFKGFLI